MTAGAVIAVGVSIVAAVATSIVPTWNAASRSPDPISDSGRLDST